MNSAVPIMNEGSATAKLAARYMAAPSISQSGLSSCGFDSGESVGGRFVPVIFGLLFEGVYQSLSSLSVPYPEYVASAQAHRPATVRCRARIASGCDGPSRSKVQ